MLDQLKKATSHIISRAQDDGGGAFEATEDIDSFSSESLPQAVQSAANTATRVVAGPFAVNEPATKEAIEERYGLKLAVPEESAPLTQEQLVHIDRALSRLKAVRPGDLLQVESITFKPSATRRGAAITGREIVFVGAFSRKLTPDEFEGRDISEDARWLYQEADTEEFLFHVMAHEIAHIVEPEAGPSFYGQRWAEPFAEDYRIYVTSGGKKAVKFDLNGNEVPNYKERLEFLRTNYPISSAPQP